MAYNSYTISAPPIRPATMKDPRDDPPPYTSSPSSPPPFSENENTSLLPPYHEPRQRLKSRPRPSRLSWFLNLIIWISLAILLISVARKLGGEWFSDGKERGDRIRIAVVGAGPAGVGAAFVLAGEAKRKGKDGGVEIVVFEGKEEVGGRMVVGSLLGGEGMRNMGAGDVASAYLGLNGVFGERVRRVLGVEFGKKERGGAVQEVGFFDGRELRSRTTRPSVETGWGAWLALVWRYGASVWRVKALPVGTMDRFEKLLGGKEMVEYVSAMVDAAEMGGPVGMGAEERLRLNGIGRKYVDEVLAPQILRQTGQRVEELSDLAISMALQREDYLSGGDNDSFEEVLKKIVKESGADLRLNTKVSGLKREMVAERQEAWILELEQPYGDHVKTYQSFDKVILAAPWNTSSLKVDQITEDEVVYYRSMWVTFLLSSKKLSGEYFGTSDEMPTQILPIPSANLPSELKGIHEISQIADVFGPDVSTESVRKLYRIFSDHSVPSEIMALFVDDEKLESHEVDIENAYPLTWPRKGQFGKFKIREGMWHTGVVEAIGSSVDLSWVAGENVGRLVAKDLGWR